MQHPEDIEYGQYQIALTADGSHTVYSADFDEHYHSHHGALTESRHVFVKAGLLHVANETGTDGISVFEMGFGTGLNALLAGQFAATHRTKVSYVGMELYPLPAGLCKRLNYPELPGMEQTRALYDALIEASWGERHRFSEHFEAQKTEADFYEADLPGDHFSLVFFDAFGSGAQPDMWREKALEKCHRILKLRGTWVTYAAKGSARRAMEAMGFRVDRIPGAPGKREMMRATKTTP